MQSRISTKNSTDSKTAEIEITKGGLKELHNLVTGDGKLFLDGRSDENSLVDGYTIKAKRDPDRVVVQELSNEIALINIDYRNVWVKQTGELKIPDSERLEGLITGFDQKENLVLKHVEGELSIETDTERIKLETGEYESDRESVNEALQRIHYDSQSDIYYSTEHVMNAKAELFSGILTDFLSEAETERANLLELSIDDGDLNVGIMDKNRNQITEEDIGYSAEGTGSSKYRYAVLSILEGLFGRVKFYLSDDSGLVIRKGDLDYFEAVYTIAPVISEGEEQ
ncbi:hypothetical protein [Candidatus Nanohalobium constans]|uniref:Uncharacterized protein n=1 Tax=Candidatus Nanohalobium constans TaxID=2565781 RepID=A0A5Q0UI73_9ARCH|nr:hypothetical protein [Candidatus Nanohalobium constans]QGA80880.1 hypothetical protein LC1Nh_1004 [Candidatus Nanohalobium constans]